MPAQFLSRAELYKGEFCCMKREPGFEVDTGTHYHDFYEIQFYLKDVGQFHLGERRCYLHYGDIAIINMFERHTLFYPKGTVYERYCLSLAPSFLLGASSEDANLLALFSQSNPGYPIFHPKEEQFLEMVDLLDRYHGCDMAAGKSIMERGYLYMVLAKLYESAEISQEVNGRDAQYIEMLATLIRFISEHLAEDLPLERLAGEVNFSVYHVCRIFKKYTGTTLTQYIVMKRIDMVKNLLARGTMPIGDVALAAGFNNYSYFYKTFHKMTGKSPAEYREACH